MDKTGERFERSLIRLTLERLFEIKSGLFGFGVVCILVLCAAFANIFSPYDPLDTNVEAQLMSPSITHLMGTDLLGRDVFSRVIHGSRISIFVGVVSVSLATILGVP